MSRTFMISLVRHGETMSNRNKIMQGQMNTLLSDLGMKQAKLVAERLKIERFTHVFSSDLSRAADTARAIVECNKYFSGKLVFDCRLRERCFGVFEGKPFVVYKQAAEEENIPIHSYTPEGGETIEQVKCRAEEFFDELCDVIAQPLKVCKNGSPERVNGVCNHTARTSPRDATIEWVQSVEADQMENLHIDIPNSIQISPLKSSKTSFVSSVTADGRSLANDGISVTSDVRSVTADVRSVTDNGRCVTADGRSVTADGRSVTSNGRSLTSDDRSVTANGKFVTSDGRPVTTNDKPPTSDEKSVTNDGRSLTTNDKSSTSEGRPMTSSLPPGVYNLPNHNPESQCYDGVMLANILIVSHGLFLRELKQLIIKKYEGQLPESQAAEASRICPNTGLSQFTMCVSVTNNSLTVKCDQVHLISDGSHLATSAEDLTSHAKFTGAL